MECDKAHRAALIVHVTDSQECDGGLPDDDRGVVGLRSATGFGGAVRLGSLGSPAFGDVPVPADYDGDGRADLAVYRRTTGEWFVFGSATGFRGATPLGAPALGDTPVGAAR
jgi:hypothetical protein